MNLQQHQSWSTEQGRPLSSKNYTPLDYLPRHDSQKQVTFLPFQYIV